MEFRSVHRHARISARKVRVIADMIRGKFADEAIEILRYQPERGAAMIMKVLQSAIGNARDPEQNKGRTIALEDLIVSEARVDGGPMFKRIKPVSRGMAYMILKRSSHIHVAVKTLDDDSTPSK